MRRSITKIILHCSDSEWGTAAEIDRWHKARGWIGIGYHYVILNGYPTSDLFAANQPQASQIGVIELGRPIDEVGAHAEGDNTSSVGICMIGKNEFHLKQIESAVHLCNALRIVLNKPLEVYGHCEVDSGIRQGKTCPNVNMDHFRTLLT